MDTIRVVLVDDHGLIRAGIRALLAELPDIEIVGEASRGAEALDLVARLRPQVLLTDISMGVMSGLEVVTRVAHDFPETRTIVLTMHTEKEYVSRALLAGAAGYLVKDEGTDELERAIRSVSRGETYLCPAVSAPIVGDYVRLAGEREQAADPLTPRQREILKLIAEGFTTKAIAWRLGLSVKTVEAHRSQIMDRLEIRDIAGLVRYAIRTGLATSGE